MGNKVRSNSQYWLKIVIIIVILWGVFFRVTNIDKKIYWEDEVYTSLRVAGYKSYQISDKLFHGNIITNQDVLHFQILQPETTFNDTWQTLKTAPEHPPLYYILLRFWQDIFGSSITINRSLSIVFSLLCFPAIYWLALELFKDNFFGLIAVALISISPMQILYAQEARQYSLFTLTIILSSLFFLKAVKSNKIYDWLLYSFALTLVFYTSLLSVFLPIINTIYIYSIKVKNNFNIKLNFWKYTILSIIFFSPWIFIVLFNLTLLKNRTKWMYIDKSIFSLVYACFFNFTKLFVFSRVKEINWILTLIIIIFIIYCLYYLIKNTDKNIWLHCLLFAIIPTIALLLSDIIFGSIRSNLSRYLFPAYVSIYLTITYTFGTKIKLNSKIWSIIFCLFITIQLIYNSHLSSSEYSWNKEQHQSVLNLQIANIINDNQNSLVITQIDKSYRIAHFISLSYQLKPETKSLFLPEDTELKYYPEFPHIYLLNPSPFLMNKVKTVYNGTLEQKNELLYKVIINNQKSNN
ncbi:glycosyltransferase family 39 protein [Geminocystis herdmanii]|uniref:glycosyltransferase family 39 protein n=1 Tax=Geminocystis herdmanii TaxID=669359 RepID=UPI0011817F3D|nr:glycosyltransferase family 39 protein [Geminocystis herdmanii]